MITPKQIYKKTAEENNFDLRLVERANEFFWKEGVVREMGNCEHGALYIKNLGTLFASKFKTDRNIKNLIRNIKVLKEKKDKADSEFKKFNDSMSILIDLLRMRNILAKLKTLKLAQKWAY